MDWKKFGRRLSCILLGVMLLLGAVACGPSGNEGGGGEEDLNGEITIAMPLSVTEKEVMKALINAYMEENPGVIVHLNETVTSEGYQDYLTQTLAVENKNDVPYDICQNSVVPDLLNVRTFIDYSQYLDETNPYNGEDAVWREGMDPLAYMPNGSRREVFSLSFNTTKVRLFYNEDLLKQAEIDASQIKTWAQFIAALDKIQQTKFKDKIDPTKEYYAVPFAVAGDQDSVINTQLSWMIRGYADQYMRSASETYHAQPNDYCFDPVIDESWELNYKPTGENPSEEDWDAAYFNDNVANYTYNPLRVLKDYSEGKAGPWTDAFKSIYANMLDLFPKYAVLYDEKNPSDRFRSTSWATAWTNFWTGNAAFILATTDAYTDYQHFYEINGEDMFVLGEMDLIPMNAHSSYPNVTPEADYVRTLGGNFGYYAIVNKNAKQNALALDFMKYWTSVAGQNVMMQKRADLGSCITGAPLIEGVTIPEGVLPAEDPKIRGLADDNPINQISQGLRLAESRTIYQTLLQDLFCGTGASSAAGYINGKMTSFQQSLTVKKFMDKYLSNQGYRSNALENVTASPF